jgi:hypothetical protein
MLTLGRVTPCVAILAVVVGAIGASKASAGKRTIVACAKAGQISFKAKPSKCEFANVALPQPSGAAVVPVTSLKWKHWGTGKAVGHGTAHLNMGVHFRVKVKLSSRQNYSECPSAFYGHVAIDGARHHSAFGTYSPCF